MQLAQRSWSPAAGWTGSARPADLVLAFGPSAPWVEAGAADALRAAYPDAHVVVCSGAGQIAGEAVVDDAVVVTAVSFDDTTVRGVALDHADGADSAAVGARLAAALPRRGLRHVLVFADGTRVNGSALVRGLTGALPGEVTVTGGLAADDDRFARTLVGLDGAPAPGRVVAIGLYGSRLRIGIGTLGGWDACGPDRLVTRSVGNVLHELDGEPALALYKRALGPLAGDVPEGTYARLMNASPEAPIGGAAGAARAAAETLADDAAGDALALLVSCVGRRLALRQRTREELEAVGGAVAERVGGAVLAGFYAYGEIAPGDVWTPCELHNQTMTITLLAEA